MEKQKDKNQDTNIALLQQDIGYIRKEVGNMSEILKRVEKNYVNRGELELILKDWDTVNKEIAKDMEALKIDLAVFKTQAKTWGGAGILALGVAQYIISLILR